MRVFGAIKLLQMQLLCRLFRVKLGLYPLFHSLSKAGRRLLMHAALVVKVNACLSLSPPSPYGFLHWLLRKPDTGQTGHTSVTLSLLWRTRPLSRSPSSFLSVNLFPVRSLIGLGVVWRTSGDPAIKAQGLLELLYSLINRWTQQSGACSCWRDHVSARFLMWWWGWEGAPWQPLLTGKGRVWGQSPQGSGGHSTCYRFEGWWYWRSLGLSLSLFLLFQQTQTKISIKCIYMNKSL